MPRMVRRLSRLAALIAASSAAGAFVGGAPWRRLPRRHALLAAEEAAVVGFSAEDAEVAEAQWRLLAAEVKEEGLGLEPARERAAELLAQNAVGRLQVYTPLAARWDEELSEELLPSTPVYGEPMLPPGLMEALRVSLGQDSHYVTGFLEESATMTLVHETFWQGELYLERLHSQPGEAPPQETLKKASEKAEVVAEELKAHIPEANDLENSVLVARQNFISTARFGYFVRRVRQRLELERRLLGQSAPGGLESFLRGLKPDDSVELARVATLESSLALELRANALFGSIRELLTSAQGAGGAEQLELSVLQGQRLTLEAAAFGASLFEAEDLASRCYGLNYLSHGSRNERPGGGM